MSEQQGDQAFRNESPLGRWEEMTYGGALSFLRRRYTREIAGADIVVSGVPYDAAVTYRPGCRLGPRAIRAASVQLAELRAFALVQFDAHCDTWADDGRAMDHGTMFARAVAEGVIDTARSTQVGLRTFNDTDAGFEILTAPWIHRHGIHAAIDIVRERAGDHDWLCVLAADAGATPRPVGRV